MTPEAKHLMKPRPPGAPDSYKILVGKISKEFAQMDAFLKNRIALGHWNVGQWIHEHLLKNQKRAEHGTNFYGKLAQDTGRDLSTLQRSVQFYRAYPISVPGRELGWGHYRRLITIKDKGERKKIEAQIIQKKWDTDKVQKYLNTKRRLDVPKSDNQPTPQLKFTRGKLQTYQIVKANKPLAGKSPLVLDLGFRLQYIIDGALKVKEQDCVEISPSPSPSHKGRGNRLIFQKVETSQDELFTYKATIDKIIDGDTLLVSFDFNLDVSISQKLRLRGIDCPEMDTDEGKRAKRFVESRLKPCEFIIVKTYKDRSDKFDRYLADVFYKIGESDSVIIAGEGKFLNQELLDERLASLY